MTTQPMAHVYRGDFLESVHQGYAVVMDSGGSVVEAWGDPETTILPRSSVKMIQALPLLESGAAKDLSAVELALACASHEGEAIHVTRVTRWLDDLGLGEADLRCGPQVSRDEALRDAMIRAGEMPGQIHNNCSGKHTGFLMLSQHLKAGPEYIEPDHPVQTAVLAAFEDVTGETSPGYGVDGCSAPNFACSVTGLARAAARFAGALGGDLRSDAMVRLREAMMTHPDMVAGTGRACTRIMQAAPGEVAVKTGAEGVFTAIAPGKRLGFAVKIADGATRAAEAAIAALLVRHGILDPDHPTAREYLMMPVLNRRGMVVGSIQPAPELLT